MKEAVKAHQNGHDDYIEEATNAIDDCPDHVADGSHSEAHQDVAFEGEAVHKAAQNHHSQRVEY